MVTIMCFQFKFKEIWQTILAKNSSKISYFPIFPTLAKFRVITAGNSRHRDFPANLALVTGNFIYMLNENDIPFLELINNLFQNFGVLRRCIYHTGLM